eukprot:13538031-Ditylum_brightwellii.AAC.1
MSHTTTEKELLAKVETLKEIRNIMFRQKRIVYTDHKNLAHRNVNIKRVICWRMVTGNFGLELVYIQGNDNAVADVMSGLETIAQELNV